MFSAFFSQRAPELRGRPVLPHGEHADEVGEEDVGRPLQIRDSRAGSSRDPSPRRRSRGRSPRAPPRRRSVMKLAAMISSMSHSALNACSSWSARPALEVRALVVEQPGGRVQALAPVPGRPGRRDRRRGSRRWRRGGAPAAAGRWRGRAGCGRARSGSTARGRAAPRPARGAVPAPAARSSAGTVCATSTGRSEDEVADQVVHLHRVAAEQAVAAALEGHEAGAGDGRDHLLRVRVGHDLVVGAVQREGGHARPRPSRSWTLTPSMAAQGLDQDVRRGLAGPGHAVLDALERVGLREETRAKRRLPVARRSRRGSRGATFSSKGWGTDSAYCPLSRIRCESRSGCSTAYRKASSAAHENADQGEGRPCRLVEHRAAGRRTGVSRS